MLKTTHYTTCTRTVPYAYAAILSFTLLAGCATDTGEQTTTPSVQSVVCSKDTDTFCIENDQQQADKYYQSGLELAAKEKYSEALEAFKQAIMLDASNPQYYYNLGLAYSFMGKTAEEEEAYLVVVAMPANPDNNKLYSTQVDAYYNLACLYALQGKKDQAFAKLEMLVSLSAKYAFHFVAKDKDLESLRDDPRYKLMLDKIATINKSSELPLKQ